MVNTRHLCCVDEALHTRDHYLVLPEQKEPVSAGSETETGEPAPINKKDYQARLGLARVLAKLPGCIDESRKYYNQVIDMAPEVGQLSCWSNAIDNH